LIISRTPFRISFFGGGTDYPEWYLKEGGAVLSTTIDKYCYLTCRQLPPFFADKHRIVWSHIETVSAISAVLHPAVREGLKFLGFDDSVGLEIHHQGDLPARTGMGSSSAFAVGLIKAMTALQGKMIGKHELALQAIELEQHILKECVGSQDQVATAYGGLNLIYFLPSGDIRVEPVTIPKARIEELDKSLMMFYTGTTRFASEIAAKVVANMGSKQQQLRQMRGMVDRAIEILNSDTDLTAFGELLHQSWLLKRELSSAISNSVVDGIYSAAMESGAIGGKLLGAGDAGFMIFFVPPEKQESVKQALAQYLRVPFSFETEGSTIIHYDE
jgi:D-glycero-alpha-D-manno-heptose-7-phosphate kinase